jgi:hypothetical protein
MHLPRATYANVMSTVAVVLALGGTAVAATQINGHNIVDRSTPGVKLIKHTVTATEIKTGTLPFVAGKGQRSYHIHRVVPSTAGGTSPLVQVQKVGTFEIGCSDSGRTVALVYTNVTLKPTHYSVVRTDTGGTTSTQASRVAAGGNILVTIANGSGGDRAFEFEGTVLGGGVKKSLDFQLTGLTRFGNSQRCAYSLTGVAG